MKCVFLVACVKKKKKCCPSRAEELYISTWFQRARKLAEATRIPRFILSVKYGLLDPGEKIGHYKLTLGKLLSESRKRWAQKVCQQMNNQLPDADRAVVMAGVEYREHPIPCLEQRYSVVKNTMEGLQGGWRLNWLKNARSSDLCT